MVSLSQRGASPASGDLGDCNRTHLELGLRGRGVCLCFCRGVNGFVEASLKCMGDAGSLSGKGIDRGF